MSLFRSIFRHISTDNSYQVSDYGPQNDAFSDFSPNDIHGLVVWLDAADANYVTESNGEVTNWNSKVEALGNVGVTGSTGAAPKYVSGYQNGRSAIMFVTAADGYGYLKSDWKTHQITHNISYSFSQVSIERYNWFYAVQLNPEPVQTPAQLVQNIKAIRMDNYGGVDIRVGAAAGWASELKVAHDNNSSSYLDYVTSSNDITSGSSHVVEVRYETHSPGSTSANFALTMSIDGGTDSKFTDTSLYRSAKTGYDVNYFQKYGGTDSARGGDAAANMYFYEILYYTGSLKDSQRTEITNYLKDKWGIS